MPRRPHRHRGRSTPRGPTSRSISLAWASSTTSSPISWPKGNLGSAAGGVALPVMAPFTLYAPSSVVVLTCAPLGWPLLRPSRSSGSLSLGTRAVASPASVTCCPGTKPPTGSAQVARGSPHGRGPAAASNSRRLSSSIGLPISCRRRGSTGTVTTGCLRRITRSGGPSRRWQSATSASWVSHRPAGMGATVTAPEAAVPRIKSPARKTRLGLPGPSSWRGWGRS